MSGEGIVPPVIWGCAAALGWGGADFIARFTGRAVGPGRALFGALLVGALVLSLLYWVFGLPWVPIHTAWWWLVAGGVGVAALTFLLYWGITRGPISVVCPIVGAYPIFILIFLIAAGRWPDPGDWTGIAVVMMGVLLVAVGARNGKDEDNSAEPPGGLKATIIIAFAASICYALAVIALQEAAFVYGELQSVALSRWVAVALTALLLFIGRRPLALPRRIWPLIALQGILDGGAYLALVQGESGGGQAVVAVTSSSFWAVTVLLARFILHEEVQVLQWCGIALILFGVGAFSVL